MFIESIKIMFLGMGTVFLFLAVMVYLTKWMSVLLLRYFPEKPKAVSMVAAQPSKPANENAKIAAILAALQHHHNLEKGKIQ